MDYQQYQFEAVATPHFRELDVDETIELDVGFDEAADVCFRTGQTDVPEQPILATAIGRKALNGADRRDVAGKARLLEQPRTTQRAAQFDNFAGSIFQQDQVSVPIRLEWIVAKFFQSACDPTRRMRQ